MQITNFEQLISHGNALGRNHLLQILDAGLIACDLYNSTKDLVRLDGTDLYIGNPDFEAADDPQSGIDHYDIRDFEHVYVVGAGKGIQRIAEAMEDILGDYLTGGEIILKHGDDTNLQKIHVTHGSHPTPDKGCVEGCKRIMALSNRVTERDLVFTISANGGSSLLTLPSEGVSLEDVVAVTRLLQIEKGIPTKHLNTIRNHIDQLKGGKIARIFGAARLVHIAVADINHHDMNRRGNYNYIMNHNVWLHALPEGSAFDDAQYYLRHYNAWDACPPSIRKVLSEAKPENETVKYEEYRRMRFRIFGITPEKRSFIVVVKKKAAELGYQPILLTDTMNVDATQLGIVLAAMMNCIEQGNSGVSAPAALIFVGEMLVATNGSGGVGGRNQECILSAARYIAGSKRIVCGAVDTDGTDGPGGFKMDGAPDCFAGAVADGFTMGSMQKKDVDVDYALKHHNTSEAQWKLGNAIIAQHGIRVNDLIVGLVLAEEDTVCKA